MSSASTNAGPAVARQTGGDPGSGDTQCQMRFGHDASDITFAAKSYRSL